MAGLLSSTGKSLSALVGEREAAYPRSGEINYRVDDAKAAMNKVEDYFATQNLEIDRTDGVSLTFNNWCRNLRSSNTEPLLRLNVESYGDAGTVTTRVSEIERVLGVAPDVCNISSALGVPWLYPRQRQA